MAVAAAGWWSDHCLSRAELGLRHRDLERDLVAAEDLAQAWSRFETDQDLEELRRRMGR